MTSSAVAMVQHAPRDLRREEFPLPEIGREDALLRVEACGICGSDYEQFEGALPVPMPLPILVGGGGKRVLSIAAREAQIVGINFNLEQGRVNRATMQTGGADSTDEKIGWIRAAAGPRFDELELNVTVFAAAVTDDQAAMAERIAPGFGMPPAETLDSPHALIGSVDQICDLLQRRRERYGISYIAFSGEGYERLAPVVARLAGT